jgi:hypothetical protein
MTYRQQIAGVSRGASHLSALWHRLGNVAGGLEKLSEKELTASPFKYASFSKDDRDFILAYGSLLAPSLFHRGNPSEVLRDDAPRIADVCYNPGIGKYLEVGVGRPQIIYLLYPTTDGEIFCRGTVMPFYEFRSETRLDDTEWRNRINARKTPPPPDWNVAK